MMSEVIKNLLVFIPAMLLCVFHDIDTPTKSLTESCEDYLWIGWENSLKA